MDVDRSRLNPFNSVQYDPTLSESIEIGGLKRTYRVHFPANVAHEQAVPIVFVFHGGGSNGMEAERMSKFSKIADREHFVAVYPDGIGHNWNDGREGSDLKPQRENVDDAAFVEAIIDSIAARQEIDLTRIYSTGISNGGMFSNFLAIKNASRFAAIASVVGGIAEPIAASFAPDSPVSVLIIQGTADPIVPYHGGKVARGDRGKIVNTDTAVQLWTEWNGCNPDPEISEIPDKAFDDKCHVQVSKWTGGHGGSEVWLYRIEGGGHTWPNGPQYLPEIVIGRVCRDFDGSETIWEFFKSHPKEK